MISLLLLSSEGLIPLIPFPTGEGENKKRGAAPLLNAPRRVGASSQ